MSQVLEEENKRLIQNKSELYGEIGKLQEHNIRLRERNLALNHEVHSKHQESCNMRDNMSTLSRDHAACTSQLTGLQTDCENLKTKVTKLSEENKELKRRSGGGFSGLAGFSHASCQTDLPQESPVVGRRTADGRAQSPLGKLTSWMGTF
jgi:DNA repair exonuclease SbcCD ATPase subunit